MSDKRLIEDYLPIEAISPDLPAATIRGAGRGEAGVNHGR
jgi:hypothetical protein